MWMFGTPFYWIIAPVVRRMRYLTMADYYEQRFGRAASVLYVVMAMVGMTVFLASVLLATTRTVQGLMGKADTGSDTWFYGILGGITIVFIVYSYWGGIIAAIRTDMIQGLMIIGLSFLAVPAALELDEVGGFEGVRTTLSQQTADGVEYLSMFDASQFNVWAVILLSISSPLTMLAFPYLMSVCGAGKTEWEGRVGFTYGNVLKRLCTIGWCVLGLCWLAYLLNTGAVIHPDAAFGDSIRRLLSPLLQGVMLACVMAAAMSSGDVVQVTLGGLFSQNIYRVYMNPRASEEQLVRVTRRTGLVVACIALAAAVLMRSSVVRIILDYVNILSVIGISTALGILWRRMNTWGVYCSTVGASVTFILTRYGFQCSREVVTGLPLLVGILGAIVGSCLTQPPSAETIEQFFKRIYVPIGREEQLERPLAEVVPTGQRLLTAGGLFLVRPSRESWVGFLVTFAICLAMVWLMYAIINA
jgi:Na+/proline symporter